MITQEMLDELNDGNIKMALNVYIRGIKAFGEINPSRKVSLSNNLTQRLISIITSALNTERNWLLRHKVQIIDELKRIQGMRKELGLYETDELSNDLLSCLNILQNQSANQTDLIKNVTITTLAISGTALLAWYIYPQVSEYAKSVFKYVVSFFTSAASVIDEEDGASAVRAVDSVADKDFLSKIGRIGSTVVAGGVGYFSKNALGPGHPQTLNQEEKLNELKNRYPLNKELDKELNEINQGKENVSVSGTLPIYNSTMITDINQASTALKLKYPLVIEPDIELKDIFKEVESSKIENLSQPEFK